MKRYFAVVVIIVITAFPFDPGFSEENPQFSLDFGGWFASMNAQAKSGVGAGSIDVSGDLGLDERKTIFPVVVNLNIGGPYNLFADFYSFSVSGDRRLTESLTFNDQTFSANTVIRGKYKQDAFKAGLKYQMSSKNDTDIYFRGGVLYHKLKLDISNSTASSSDSLDIPFPFVGFEMESSVAQNIKWGGLIEGFLFSFQDDSTTYFDLDVFVKYYALENLSIRAGYRYENIDSEKDEVDFDAGLNGVYLGANIEF